MPSDQQNSELDDEAIKVLFAYAGWDCHYDRGEWHIKPPRAASPYCSFTTLQKAMNYFLLYKRVWEKHE